MDRGPYRTRARSARRAEAAERCLDGLVSAVLVLGAGVLALVSGLSLGAAAEGGLGVALVAVSLYMLAGEARAAGLRDGRGSSAASRSR